MKTQSSLLLIALTLGVSGIVANGQGTAFTYQGRLNDGAGPATGVYDLQFTVFDSTNQPGTVIAGPITNTAASVSNGLFTTSLDFGSGVFDGHPRFLEIAVRTNGGLSFTTLVPRQALTPTPYAIFANTASNLSGVVASGQLAGTYGSPVNFNNGANSFDGSFSGQFFGSSFTGGNFTGNFIGSGSALIDVWHTTGNFGTLPPVNFLGTTDNQPLVMKVNNQEVMRYEPTTDTPNVVGGWSGNYVQPGLPGVTIGGGGSVVLFNGKTQPNVATNNGQYAVIAGGYDNMVTNYGGAILGGSVNLAGGNFAVIGGGQFNSNLMAYAVIGGGYRNIVTTNVSSFGFFPYYSVIGGGYQNVSAGGWSVIGGGYFNTNRGISAFIGSGDYNLVNGDYSSIGSGLGNVISSNASYSAIGGGVYNEAGGVGSVIGGGGYDGATGIGNQADGNASVIGGGLANSIHTNSPYAVIGGGQLNSIAEQSSDAAIPGGANNTIQSVAFSSTIGGGYGNTIQGGAFNSTLAGGFTNTISSNAADVTISGGSFNVIGTNANLSVIAGGTGNNNSGTYSAIGGGVGNVISNGSFAATISGGSANIANGYASAALAGQGNAAVGNLSTIVGGYYNLAQGGLSTAVAGQNNAAIANNSTVVGGLYNTNFGVLSFIGGGDDNIAGGWASVVSGGESNRAYGAYSMAAGYHAWAFGNGDFVWSDSQLTDFFSTSTNQFLIRAQNGVGINTNNPQAALHVNGTIMANNFSGSGSSLSGLSFSQLTGTLLDAQLSGGYSGVVSFSNPGDSFAGNGSGLTSLNGNNISSGTVNDARLSSNVALLNRDPQTFTGSNIFNSSIVLTDPTKTIQFPATTGANSPMITMFASGTANVDRMVIAHSAAFSNYGLQYQDSSDRFNFLSSGTALMTIDLGGFRVGINNPAPTNLLMVANARCDGATWINASDRNLKENFTAIDGEKILEKVAELPITQWNYKTDARNTHLGPVAQDFHAAFQLGADDRSIATVDESGVALAAIQGLNKKVEEQRGELQQKNAEIADLKQRLERLERLVERNGNSN